MDLLHRVLAYSILGGLGLIFLLGLGLRAARREEAPPWFWGIQHYLENILVIQVVVGLILLFVMGRRIGGTLGFFHYLYGSLFPAIAIIGGRISGLRREAYEYMGPVWGAMFAWGLSMRAMLTGLAGLV